MLLRLHTTGGPALPALHKLPPEVEGKADPTGQYPYNTVPRTNASTQAGAPPSFSMSTMYRSQVSIVPR